MSGDPFTEPELELGRLFAEGRLPPYPPPGVTGR